MASYLIDRVNYVAEYAYFIPTTGTDWQVESLGTDYVYEEQEGEEVLISQTPFAVKISSEEDDLPTLQAFLDGHASLTVNANKTNIQADGEDTVAFTIPGQSAFSYRLMRGNIVLEAGEVNDGVLEFASDDPALYTVELTIGSNTGYAQIKVVANG